MYFLKLRQPVADPISLPRPPRLHRPDLSLTSTPTLRRQHPLHHGRLLLFMAIITFAVSCATAQSYQSRTDAGQCLRHDPSAFAPLAAVCEATTRHDNVGAAPHWTQVPSSPGTVSSQAPPMPSGVSSSSVGTGSGSSSAASVSAPTIAVYSPSPAVSSSNSNREALSSSASVTASVVPPVAMPLAALVSSQQSPRVDSCVRWPRKLRGPLVSQTTAQCPLKSPESRSKPISTPSPSPTSQSSEPSSKNATATAKQTSDGSNTRQTQRESEPSAADPVVPVTDFAIIPNRPSPRPIVPPPIPPALAAGSGRNPRPAQSSPTALPIPPASSEPIVSTQPPAEPTSPLPSASSSAPAPSPSPSPSAPPPPPAPPAIPTITPSTLAAKHLRDRFNYASIDCAAAVRSANADSKGTSAILNENKDSYLLSPCTPPGGPTSGPRHVVIELCNEILIDTLVLSNYELFSSTFRTVRAFVNSVYPETPEKPWRALATLAAANVRSPQVFVVDRAVTWARYVRLEFVDQYGSQYFCPLSNIRVYGTTMLEEYKRDADAGLMVADEAGEGGATDGGVRRPPAFGDAPVGLPPPLVVGVSKGMIDPPPPLALVTTTLGTSGSAQSPTVGGQLRRQSDMDLAMPTSSVPHPAYVPFLPPKLRLSPFSDSGAASEGGTGASGVGSSRSSNARESQSTAPTRTGASVTTSALTPTATTGVAANSTAAASTSLSTTAQTPVPVTTLTAVGSPSTPVQPSPALTAGNATLTTSIPVAPPLQPPPPPPPQQEEGIYKVIMKRFASVEANYKLLLQYMDDYAKGINEVIRANDENQSVHFSRAMAQLSQHVAARLGQIRDELAQEADDLRLLTHRHEEALSAQLARLSSKLQTTEQRLTSTWRWSLVHFSLFVVVALGPWMKSILITVLQVSLSASPPAHVQAPTGRRSHRHHHHSQQHLAGGASPVIATGIRRSHQATSPLMHHHVHPVGGAGIHRQRSPATSLSASAGLLMGRLASASFRSVTGASGAEPAVPVVGATSPSVGAPRRISGSSFSTRARAKRRSYVVPTVVMEPSAPMLSGNGNVDARTLGGVAGHNAGAPVVLSPRPVAGGQSKLVLVPLSTARSAADPAHVPAGAAPTASSAASASEWSSVSNSSSSSSPSPTLRPVSFAGTAAAVAAPFSLAVSMPSPASASASVFRMRSGSLRKRRTVSDPFLMMHAAAASAGAGRAGAGEGATRGVMEPVTAMVVGHVPSSVVAGARREESADKENVAGAPPTPTPEGQGQEQVDGDGLGESDSATVRKADKVTVQAGNGSVVVGPSPPDSDCGGGNEPPPQLPVPVPLVETAQS